MSSFEELLECSFLVPNRRDGNLSDGQPHEPQVWDWLFDELFDKFGGATRSKESYEGFYLDPDTQEQIWDESVKFMVAVSHDRIDDLRKLLRAACVRFQQKSIYLSVAGKVEFLEGADDKS